MRNNIKKTVEIVNSYPELSNLIIKNNPFRHGPRKSRTTTVVDDLVGGSEEIKEHIEAEESLSSSDTDSIDLDEALDRVTDELSEAGADGPESKDTFTKDQIRERRHKSMLTAISKES